MLVSCEPVPVSVWKRLYSSTWTFRGTPAFPPVVGLDLVDEITTALHRMQRSGAEYVQVRLPANQPALATMGAGLVELGLGYAALIPGFRRSQGGTGDMLVAQWIEDVEVDTSGFVYATEAVGELVEAVVRHAGPCSSLRWSTDRRVAG